MYCKGELSGHQPRPDDIPSNPNKTYKDKGWAGIRDWLGTAKKGKLGEQPPSK